MDFFFVVFLPLICHFFDNITTPSPFAIVAVHAYVGAPSATSEDGLSMRVGVRRTSRVKEVLSRVPLTPPWTVQEFLVWLEKDCGRSIRLERYAESAVIGEGRCGLLFGSADEYTIMYDPDRSERLQRQTIFHEVAHILCSHAGEPFRPTVSPLTTGLDPAAIEFIMRRSSFDSPTEAEAELVGTKLAVLARGSIGDTDRGHFNRIISTVIQ
ncbi:ImmA/IrrE family metallo-endopeptidase [Rhodococcus marinonascens]|uniref:ImmA/IrrE family metallo-endopeptidase n=1 Tax=Rhodococcus marinonascens TaxID=38311 RepID=UPI000A6B3352|nr:ImmA/IrrE family metallo-endopeptidase [Rhodococcus marinonascens]